MLLNVKRVKSIIKEYDKQVSREFIDRLDAIVRERIYKAIRALPSGAKRLKASELL